MGLSRRRVLALGAVGAVAATGAGDGGPARVRREITSPEAAADVTIFAAAMAAMRVLPDADPRSLTSLARLHAEHAPHASAAFLPWHRAFLAGFEGIARGLTGAPDFALPYWDWTTGPRVPGVFFERLSFGVRAVGRDASADRSFVGPAVLRALLDVRDAALFLGQPDGGYGLLEQGPHNYIHGFIGGTMGTLLSPLDPIFWSHHAFLDRVWTQWSAKPISTVEEEPGYDGVMVRPATLTFPGAERRHGGARLVFGFSEAVDGGVHVYVNGAFAGSVAFFTHTGHTGMGDMPYRLPVTSNGPITATFRPVNGAALPPVSARLVPVRTQRTPSSSRMDAARTLKATMALTSLWVRYAPSSGFTGSRTEATITSAAEPSARVAGTRVHQPISSNPAQVRPSATGPIQRSARRVPET
jgi:hypothetical protein